MVFPILLPHSREGVGREEGAFLSIVRTKELSKCSGAKPVSSRKPVWACSLYRDSLFT